MKGKPKRGEGRQARRDRSPSEELIDIYDGLRLEMDRLDAFVELLGATDERLESRVVPTLALFLRDVHERASELVRRLRVLG